MENSFRVENSGREQRYFDPIEKLYNIPLYVVRKLVLLIAMSSVLGVAHASKLFGFHFDYELEDKERWNWLSNISVPRYGVVRKR